MFFFQRATMNYYVNCCDFFNVAPHDRLDKDGFEIAIQQDPYVAIPVTASLSVAFFRPGQSVNKNTWTKAQKKIKGLQFVVQDDMSNSFFENRAKFDPIEIIKMRYFALPVNSCVNIGFKVTIMTTQEFIEKERYGVPDDNLALPTVPFDDQLITLHNIRIILGEEGIGPKITRGSILLMEHLGLDDVFNYKVV